MWTLQFRWCWSQVLFGCFLLLLVRSSQVRSNGFDDVVTGFGALNEPVTLRTCMPYRRAWWDGVSVIDSIICTCCFESLPHTSLLSSSLALSLLSYHRRGPLCPFLCCKTSTKTATLPCALIFHTLRLVVTHFCGRENWFVTATSHVLLWNAFLTLFFLIHIYIFFLFQFRAGEHRCTLAMASTH